MPGAAGDDHDDHDAHDDVEDDEPEPLGRPPHPLDRLWRHPSELPASATAPGAPLLQRPRHLSLAGVALAAAGTGALATVVILAAFGVFDDGAAQAPTSRR